MIEELRVLVVRQPWASLIASGRKTLELRRWTTSYRGPVLIIAAARPWKGEHRWPMNGPRGVTLCIVDIVDVRPATPADERGACIAPPPDHYALVLANPRPVHQVKVRGLLGLYKAPATLRQAVGAAA